MAPLPLCRLPISLMMPMLSAKPPLIICSACSLF